MAKTDTKPATKTPKKRQKKAASLLSDLLFFIESHDIEQSDQISTVISNLEQSIVKTELDKIR